MRWSLIPDSLLRFLMEQQLTQLATHLRAVVESDFLPACSALRSRILPQTIPIFTSAISAVRVRFGQPMSELVYPKSILSAKPRMAHGLTSKILQETCDRILGEVKTSTGVSGEVYQIIASTPGHSPSMEGVARQISHNRTDAQSKAYTRRVPPLLVFSTMSAATSRASISVPRN